MSLASLSLRLLVVAVGVSVACGAAAGRLERIDAAGELRVCIWPDYYSISYRNPKTRQLSGIDIDLAQALSRDLGVKLRFVDSSFPALVDNLLQGRCDVAMHAIGITPQRQAQLAFTKPYLRSDIYAIAPKGHAAVKTWADLDKPGHVIAVQEGTVMEPVMQAQLKQARLLRVKPPMTRENEVESGRADAFMTDYPYSRRMVDLTDWARVVAPPQRFHPTDYAWAVAPGDEAWLARLNRFLDTVRQDGRLLQAAREHRLEPIVVQE